MTIYIDVLFAINFISDFIILLLCDMNFKKGIFKKIVASIIGSLYACFFVFDLPRIIYSLFGKIVVLIFMCFIAFFPCNVTYLLNKCATFLFISILFCGVFYAGEMLFQNPYFLYEISDIVWIVCMCTALFISRFAYLKIKKTLYFDKHKLKIFYNEKCVTLNGMIDTGNSLYDPVSSFPVLIINEKILKELFSPSATKSNLCEFVNPEDFRIIPYKTISENGVIYGFIPNKLIYEGKKINDIIIAVAPSPITSDALISPQIIWKDW